ncbi:RNA polymerase II subunit A C-terminal domain phosphatase-like [Paramacrobiotus metropolitanus]|uniref:RNA polymerase II subunit A C-terminal domain phosphatase-like n=1 Tax=Paramacrobiotus metropolitanus TaxID=2943436 RepID=UPI00244615C7|nr:RNA polymerase II subunit A C-terminal domain phosphatase-like [Paramacrobiotus metropolitanus]
MTEDRGLEENTKDLLFDGPTGSTIAKFKVRVGEQVSRGQVLFTYRIPGKDDEKISKSDEGKFRCPESALIVQIPTENADVLTSRAVVMRIKPGCPHEIRMKDLCAACGADLRVESGSGNGNRKSESAPGVTMVHNISELKVSKEIAQRIGEDDLVHLIGKRRLALLVDLDQTIIHTTIAPVNNNLKDVHHFQLSKGHFNNPWYHTKLRPGTLDFLADLLKYYQLHICTFGNRMYAHKIAEILDPKQTFFSHRILSRDEISDPCLKTANIKDLFPVGDDMVCIIDDREDVWNYAANLVHVRPYSYFKNTGDINAPFPKNAVAIQLDAAAPEKAEAPSEATKHQYENRFADGAAEETQEDADDYLLYLRTILINIHAEYYRQYDELNPASSETASGDTSNRRLPKTKEVIPVLRKKVLQGCRLVFSGFFPSDTPSPERDKAEALVRSFGAVPQPSLLDKAAEPQNYTTHLIAAKDGTEKVHKAREMHVHVVNADWLAECVRRWERVDEKLFPLSQASSSSSAGLVLAAKVDAHRNGRPQRSDAAVNGGKAVGKEGERKKSEEAADGASYSAVREREEAAGPRPTAVERSVSCLSGLSADDILCMDHEVDDAIGEEDDEEEFASEHAPSKSSGLPHESAWAVGHLESSSSSEEADVLLDEEERGAKRKRDSLELESSEDEEAPEVRLAKQLRQEDLSLTSSSAAGDSGEDGPRFSDDDNTLGEMARELDESLEGGD